ncbi:hypothetical protein DIPPA_35620 [Diplonema papillatum]|nr:hypothetical protein DIPPA_35620 [Diplonema papillatum]
MGGGATCSALPLVALLALWLPVRAVVMTPATCYDFDSNASLAVTACAGAELSFQTSALDQLLIMLAPGNDQTLCVWTGTASKLSDMPGTLPTDAECTNGGSSTGWSARTGNTAAMVNTPVYVRDLANASDSWVVFIHYMGKDTDANTFDFARLPSVPTAAPATEAPATAAPATGVPGVNATGAPAPAPGDTAAPAVNGTTGAPGAGTLAPATGSPGPVRRCASYSWGSEVTAGIVLSGDAVTLSLTGPVDTWFAAGFNGSTMEGTWAVVASGAGTAMHVAEYVLGLRSKGSMVAFGVWSDELRSGRRTVEAEVPATGRAAVFSAAADPRIVLACGSCQAGSRTTTFASHGGANRLAVDLAWEACPPPPDTPEPTPANTQGAADEEDEGDATLIAVAVTAAVLVLCACLAAFCYLRRGKADARAGPDFGGVMGAPLLPPDAGETPREAVMLGDDSLFPPPAQQPQQEPGPQNPLAAEPKSGPSTNDSGDFSDAGIDPEIVGATPPPQFTRLSLIDTDSFRSSAEGSEPAGETDNLEHELSELDAASDGKLGSDAGTSDVDHIDDLRISFKDPQHVVNYYEDSHLRDLRSELASKQTQLARIQAGNKFIGTELAATESAIAQARAEKKLPVGPGAPPPPPPPPAAPAVPIPINLDDL